MNDGYGSFSNNGNGGVSWILWLIVGGIIVFFVMGGLGVAVGLDGDNGQDYYYQGSFSERQPSIQPIRRYGRGCPGFENGAGPVSCFPPEWNSWSNDQRLEWSSRQR